MVFDKNSFKSRLTVVSHMASKAEMSDTNNKCDWIYENCSYRPRQEVDFFTQTQSLMNALSSFTATVDQSKVVCFCWLLF